MSDLRKATADLSEIKLRLTQSQQLSVFVPLPLCVVGIIAFVCGGAQSQIPALLETSTVYFGFWIAIALFGVFIISVSAYHRSRQQDLNLQKEQLTSAAEAFLPTGFAGATIGWVLYSHAPEALWILPGLWSTLLSLAVFAARPRLPNSAVFVAIWYLFAGVTVLILSAESQSFSPWFMALPFGVGQIMMAAVVAYGRKPNE